MSKPVAWLALNELNGVYTAFTDEQKQKQLPHISQCYGKWIALYTRPSKQLSDGEIANVWLFLEGKAEGVSASGGTFNFPVEFYKAVKELEK